MPTRCPEGAVFIVPSHNNFIQLIFYLSSWQKLPILPTIGGCWMIRYDWLAIFLSVSGLIGLGACSETKVTNSKNFVSVDASVKDNQFLLSLPVLPGVAVLGSEAKMKIVKGHVKFPAALAACSNSFSLDQVPRDRTTIEAPAQQKKLSSDPIKLDGDVVAEMSVPFKAGQQLGPIMLAQGDYSINLEIVERDSVAYFGAAQFSIASGVISRLDLKLEKTATCPKPDGGVVINPLIVQEKKSSCEFVGKITQECNVASAYCEWREPDSGELISGTSRCSIGAARQNLIQQLCDRKTMVGENFLNEIYCAAEISDPPPPVEESNKISPFKGTVIVKRNGEDYLKQDISDLKEAVIIRVMGLSGDKITWSNSINSKTIETILDGKGDYDNRGHYIEFGITVTPEEPPVKTMSACDFSFGIPSRCDIGDAVCTWISQSSDRPLGDNAVRSAAIFQGRSQCSVGEARQNLVDQLCKSQVQVGEKFAEEIRCDVISIPLPPVIQESFKVIPFDGHFIATRDGQNTAVGDVKGLKEPTMISLFGAQGSSIIWKNSLNDKTIETVFDGTDKVVDFGLAGGASSACDLSFGIPSKCDVGGAVCTWISQSSDRPLGDNAVRAAAVFQGESQCSEGEARQNLVNQLCKSQVQVGEKFAEEIRCVLAPIPLLSLQERFQVVPFDGHFIATRDGQNIAVGDVKGAKEPTTISLSGVKGSSVIWKNSLNNKIIETVFDGTDKVVDFGLNGGGIDTDDGGLLPESNPAQTFAKVGVGFELGDDFDFNDHYACMLSGQFTVEGRNIISRLDQTVPISFGNRLSTSSTMITKVFYPSGEIRQQKVFLAPNMKDAARSFIDMPKGASITFEVWRAGAILQSHPQRAVIDLNKCRSDI